MSLKKIQVILKMIIIVHGMILKWAVVAELESERVINQGCSQYKVRNFADFNSNMNLTFKELREQLNGGKKFATAQQSKGSDQVYSMVQCRQYLSTADCVACFSAAQSLIRNCSAANGARVIFLGCFLSKENIGGINNLNNDDASSTGSAVYGIAQCVETITEAGCRTCLSWAFDNIQKCLANAFGWAVDVGCFLRYSDTPFFANNQTTDISPFLRNGSSKKKAIIGGVVGGGVGLILFALLVWFIISRKSKTIHRGNISEATELQGPVNYRYKDLISATRNFSEENKLGEGGFGDIYKGTLKNGKIVAVKKLAIGISRRTLAEFENEVRLISNVHHRNLIRLLGCCSQGPELILVYEYMANSSLDKFLFGNS